MQSVSNLYANLVLLDLVKLRIDLKGWICPQDGRVPV